MSTGGGRLTMINSVLTPIPTYCMLVFQLVKWFIHEIDKTHRFPPEVRDLDQVKCHLSSWKSICKTMTQGDCGVLDLQEFNKTLLGK